MNLDFKKAITDLFSLKYFWIYLLIFAVVTTLSSIIQSAHGIPYNSLISNVISIFTYIATGYLFIMVNSLLNDKSLNIDDETFGQNIWNCAKKGLKAFLGTLSNTIIGFLFGSLIAIISVFAFMKLTNNLITENNLLSFPALNIIFLLIVLFLMIYMLFVLKLLPVAYSENFSLKMMFCWRKVLKKFFQKGNIKDTLSVICIYAFSIIIIFLVMFSLMFLFNLIFVYFMKILLMKNYVAVAFLINISSVITPFAISMMHFILSGFVYHLLGQIYKRTIE